MWLSRLFCLLPAVALANQNKINVTKLDCGMRQLALDYAKKLNGNPEVWKQVHEALRLQYLCNMDIQEHSSAQPRQVLPSQAQRRTQNRNSEFCTDQHPCIYVALPASSSSLRSHNISTDGTMDHPHTSIHEALEQVRSLRKKHTVGLMEPKLVLRQGIHSLQAKTLELGPGDSGLSIVGYPGEDVWISGGLPLDNVDFQPDENDKDIYVANLTDRLQGHAFPKILSLFTTSRRYIRARFPHSNPETDQWGYASPHRLDYSIASALVLEWHRPPKSTLPINFTFYDFKENPPSGVPAKNDTTQSGYNWYASGRGGACSEVWGEEADSYWCSNSSQGGWSEVDRECAVTGQMQLPIGMTYNSSSKMLAHLDSASLQGGILHAWHSQSWAMHMFEITQNSPGEMTFAKGGGRQGGRNWCRCDQCTYAAGWCGQHQTPPLNDTRMISGTWMVENVKSELDQPGEYYFDEDTRLLYVKPNSTLDLVDFRIGMIENIFDFRDAANITVENLGFRDSAPTYLSEHWSAPSGGDWSLHRGGAIFLENVANVTIRNCHFQRLDGNAIFLSRKTRNVVIDGNQFEWIGENAIATWGDTEDYDATAGEFPMHTLVQNNVMRELGIYQKQSSGLGQCKTALSTIRNNIMFNMPRAAINMNDMLGGGDVIEGNLIFNTCRESGDHGPINSWDRQAFLTTLRDGITKSFDPMPRTIQHNFIIANYGASQGVDNDDGSSWYRIHHNLFYSAEGFKMDYGGHDSVFEDNLVMAFPYDGSQCFNIGGFLKGHGDILRRNRCMVGLGNPRGSGCGDPSCASPNPESREENQLVGKLWGGCEDSHVTLAANEYYTPDGEAKIQCGEDTFSLQELQDKFGLEVDSMKSKFPDEDTMVAWANEML